MKTPASSAGSAPLDALLFVLGVGMAYAGATALDHLDPMNISLATWVWVVGLSFAGWFASSARTLVGWVDGEGNKRLENRLTILGRIVASLIAGFAAELIGLAAGTSNLVNFLAVIGAAYAGDRFIENRLGGISRPRHGIPDVEEEPRRP